MKKKIVFIMMAIILVLSVAIGCSACNKKGELKLNNKMDAGEIMAALVNADIKNLTMVATEKGENGEDKITYATQNGFCKITEKDGVKTQIDMVFYEDGRYYNLSKKGETTTKTVYSLDGNVIDMSWVDAVTEELNYLNNSLFAYKIYKDNDEEFDDIKVRVENKNSIVAESEESKTVYKDFNKTNLVVPEEFKDYKSYESQPVGIYERTYINGQEGREFSGRKGGMEFKEFTIASKYTIDGVELPVISANITNNYAQIMNIPTSVVKISFLNNAYNTEFRYMGTKAEWAKVSIAEKPKKAIVVKCTDGEITVEKSADN